MANDGKKPRCPLFRALVDEAREESMRERTPEVEANHAS
jgi:hypothetical protein